MSCCAAEWARELDFKIVAEGFPRALSLCRAQTRSTYPYNAKSCPLKRRLGYVEQPLEFF